jgi:hypothetical protein
MYGETTYRFWVNDDSKPERFGDQWPHVPISFFVMWIFVGLVSIYDAWLVVKYWDSILELERNPICHYLIRLGNGDSAIFVRAKLSGTIAVLSVLAALYRNNRRLALPVTCALSCFQLALLVYLNVR